ncbi:MAG: tryptophan synthase subunit alpha [bacterium]|nr:tryptophan synthase subunit alpha [bacterium]
MSSITDAFTTARKSRRSAFVAYITAGDPNLDRTVEVVRSLRRGGADLIELGVPFSDPIADGPPNQRAAERALASGTNLGGILECVQEIRRHEDIPIVLFTYANPVVRYGINRFAEDAGAVGVDGVLFTDVPVEEMHRFSQPLASASLDPIMLVTPTSTKERIRAASRIGGGFLYLVSRTGVTGVRVEVASELVDRIKLARKLSKLPVAVGFGISTPAQVSAVAARADGVVVGSAIVDRIAELGDVPELGDAVQRFVTPLVEACRR